MAVVCPTEGGQQAENAEPEVLRLHMEGQAFEQLQGMRAEDVENLSSNILERKFAKHIDKIE